MLSDRPFPLHFTYGKRFIPKTEYINNMIKRRAPILANWPIVRKNVSKIALRALADLINLMTLTILKERNTLMTVPKAVRMDIYSNMDPAIVNTTTTKSNLLNGSKKYYHPRAVNFMTNSSVNTPRKNIFE